MAKLLNINTEMTFPVKLSLCKTCTDLIVSYNIKNIRVLKIPLQIHEHDPDPVQCQSEGCSSVSAYKCDFKLTFFT